MPVDAGRLCDPPQTEQLLAACERILVTHGSFSQCASIEPRHSEAQSADLRIRFKDGSWLRSPNGQTLIETFLDLPTVAEAYCRRSEIFLTFENDALINLERRTASVTDDRRADSQGILRDRCFHVSFVQPNANKALHLGHLRNIFIGQALCRVLESAGADVRRRSVVADIGRRICEAMAGYLQAYRGEDPQSTGLASDRFVELCSRAYQTRHDQSSARSSSGPNGQEDESLGDTAEEILTDLLQDERGEQQLWHRVRAWVLTGHESTLSRVGTSFDHLDFESDGISHAHELVALGLRTGLFEQEPSGPVIYRSRRPECSTMVLLNEAGLPTECARILSVCHTILDELDPAVEYLELLGDEWRPAQTVMADLLEELLPEHPRKVYSWLYYGLVTTNHQKIGSSSGEVLWIDDLLDELISSPVVADLHAASGEHVDHETLADIVVRATFLCTPTSQPFSISPEKLLTDRCGPGWTVALAWCRANTSDSSIANHALARAGLLLSESFSSVLRRAVDARDPAILASYLLRLSKAFLTAPHPGPSACSSLHRVLDGLGFNLSPHKLHHDLAPKPGPRDSQATVQA